MKCIQKGLPICFALVVGVAAGWMVVQQASVTPSEAQTALRSQVKLLPPKLVASPAPPRHIQELEKMGLPPDPTSRQRPTVQSLLEKIRSTPNGPEKIEEAKRRGALIGMRSDEPATSLSWLHLFRVEKAEAQVTLPSKQFGFLKPFSLTLDPNNNWYSSTPSGYVSFYGALEGYGSRTTSVRLLTSSGFTSISQPSASFYVNIPTDGWYIINIEATSTRASLSHGEPIGEDVMSTELETETWDYSSRAGIQSYPAMLELGAGAHYFYWISTSAVWVCEANAYSL